jgi:Nuclease-related domain
MLEDVKTGDRLTSWMRRRELASDRRAGQFSRSEALKRQYAWAQRNWRIIGGLALLVATMLPLVVFLPRSTRAFAAGAWIATGVWLGLFQIVLASGTAPRMMGDWGEQFTARELRKLSRRGWMLINHVCLRPHGDIDHVVVGPAGVLVVETKWSGDPWVLDTEANERVRHAVEYVARDARDIWGMFPNHVGASAVKAIVVLWGGSNPHAETLREIDGVTVMRGHELQRWLLSATTEQVLTDSQVEHVWKTLERHVRLRDAADLKRDGPSPRSPGEWIRPVIATTFAFWLGLLLSASAWTIWRSFALFWAFEAAFLLVAVAALRRSPYRAAPIAWLLGVSIVGLLVATIEIGAAL